MQDPYEILGVDNDASEAEIKSAYRKLSKTTHPDSGGNEALFRIIEKAYRHLSGSPQTEFDETKEAPNGGTEEHDEQTQTEPQGVNENSQLWWTLQSNKTTTSFYGPQPTERAVMERIRKEALFVFTAAILAAAFTQTLSVLVGGVLVLAMSWTVFDTSIKRALGGTKPKIKPLIIAPEYYDSYDNADDWFLNNTTSNYEPSDDDWFTQQLATIAASTTGVHVFCTMLIPGTQQIYLYIVTKGATGWMISSRPQTIQTLSDDTKTANKLLRKMKLKPLVLTQDSTLVNRKQFWDPNEFLEELKSEEETELNVAPLTHIAEWCQ